MLNENLNNLNWKNKLEDDNSLPGDIIADKNATWEKLHNRLRPKRRRLRYVWYWAAASFLLIMLIIPLFKANMKPNAVVKNISLQNLPKQKTIYENVTQQAKKDIVISVKGIKKRKVLIPTIAFEKVETSLTNTSQKITNSATTVNNQTNLPSVQIVEKFPVQELCTVNSIALLSNSKRLKVIHINELGDAIPESQNRKPIADYRSIQIRLINQEVYTITTPTISNTGFNIFKTKNPSSN